MPAALPYTQPGYRRPLVARFGGAVRSFAISGVVDWQAGLRHGTLVAGRRSGRLPLVRCGVGRFLDFSVGATVRSSSRSSMKRRTARSERSACRPRPSGSTLAGRVLPHVSASGTMRVNWASMRGTRRTPDGERNPWAGRSRTHGASTTCMATCGSGVPIGSVPTYTPSRPRTILRGLFRVHSVCSAAGPGPLGKHDAGWPTASGASRPTRAASSASG